MKPEWRVRLAREKDRALLSGFTCADPSLPWALEVEEHIQTQLLDWGLAPGAVDDDPRILLVFERRTKQLVGVAAHERVILRAGRTEKFPATKIHVVAVSRGWQGRVFVSGERVSDVVMSAVMSDIASRTPPRDARILAVVHQENSRSLALCRRHGLVHELSRPVPDYVRLVTEHRPR